MRRTIKLNGANHVVDFGTLEAARVTIHQDGAVAVSTDLDGRTPGAEFEAIFIGTQSIEVLTGPSDENVEFGPLEPGEGETTLSVAKARKLRELAAARYASEVAGVTVNGATVRTDRESQAMITGAALQATQDAAYTCRWKTEKGFVELTAAQIVAVATAVRAHVQAQFDREAELIVQVNVAATVEAVEAITWQGGEN